jgi:hypothetical protein
MLRPVFRARCFKGQGNAWANNMTERTALAGKNKFASTTLLTDQRGAVALEMPAVVLFMMMSLLVPLADLAIAGFQFLSAQEALRAFGQYAQHRNSQDVASTTVAGYLISNLRVVCGDTNLDCSPSNITLTPRYYSYTTTVTLSPMVLRPVLCTSGNANPCSFTLSYSERFQ